MDRFTGNVSFFRIIYFSVFTIRECATQHAFTVLPTSTVGIIGRNVTLKCALSNGVYSLSWQNPSGVIVYEKGFGILPGFEDRYRVEESENSYNLVVLNAAVDDAGRYTCECPSWSQSASAEVILLGRSSDSRSLNCFETTSNDDDDFGNLVEGDQIALTCHTTYYGLWGPTQDWMDSRGSILFASDISSGNIIEYTNTGTVDARDNGLRWIVDSYIPPPPFGTIPDDDVIPPERYYYRNAPVWNEVYESTIIMVYYPVTNMNLDNVKHVYNPGEEITCAAEGNPEPEIRWVDDANATVVESHILTIEASMEGTQTFSCLATNDVRGATYSLLQTITFNVTIPRAVTMTTTMTITTTKMIGVTSWEEDSPKGSNTAIIGGSVGAIVFLLIVIFTLIGVICYLHKRTKTNETSTAPVDTVQHEYNYISEVPPPVAYVNTVTEARPSVNGQYEDIGGNQKVYPPMYITIIQDANSEELKKYENVPMTQEYEHLREHSRLNTNNEYASLNENDTL